MKILRRVRIIERGCLIQQIERKDGIIYLIEPNETAFLCAGYQEIYKGTYVYQGLREDDVLIGDVYGDEVYRVSPPYRKFHLEIKVPEGHRALKRTGPYNICFNYLEKEHLKQFALLYNSEKKWEVTRPFGRCLVTGNYGLLWKGYHQRGGCELIDIESGVTIWEKDYPNTYIKFVYAYEDRLVLQYGSELKYRDYRKLRCLSMQTGEVLWESDVLGNYERYGSSKLVSFWSYSHIRNHNEYAELDIKTGEVKTKYFPDFWGDVAGLMVYKDYLFFSIQNRMSIGIIDLKSQEIIQEYSVEYTPGEFNQLKSKGVYAGCLYLEVMTEVNHSDIHVFELAED